MGASMSDSSKPVTIKDIARECGVTATTVSLALRNHPRISDKTKAKVRATAEKLGYHRNPMISALMANLSQSRTPLAALPLAVIYTHDWEMIQENSFHSNIWGGMDQRAQRLGFKLERFHLNEKRMTGRRLTQILDTRGITGLIVPPLYTPGGHLSIDWPHFSAVAIGYSMLSPNLHRVCPNQYRGIRMALRELTKRGYTRPGLLLNRQSDQRSLHLWSSGFLGYEAQQNREEVVPILNTDNVHAEELKSWLDTHRPDVIVSSDLEVLKALDELEIRYPEEIGVVTLSRCIAENGIAGIDQQAFAIGEAAVEQVVQMMYYNQRGIPELPRVIQIPSRWGEGPSIRPKPVSATLED